MLSLAKDLTRIFIERIDQKFVISITKPQSKVDGVKGIKALENFLTGLGLDGRQMTSKIVGIYELRLLDSHLPKSEVKEIYYLAGISEAAPPMENASSIILEVANFVRTLSAIIENGIE